MQVLCKQCGHSVDLGTAKAAACPHCGTVAKLLGPHPGDSLSGEVGFAELSRQKLTNQLEIVCPECHRTFLVAAKYAGQRAKCSACGTIVGIPGPEPSDADSATVSSTPASSTAASVFDVEPKFGDLPAAGLQDVPTPSAAVAPPMAEVIAVEPPVDLGPSRQASVQPRRKRRSHYAAGLAAGLFLAAILGLWGMVALYNHLFASSGEEIGADTVLPTAEDFRRATGGVAPNPSTPESSPSAPETNGPAPQESAPAPAATTRVTARFIDARRSVFVSGGYTAARAYREFWHVTIQIDSQAGRFNLGGQRQDIVLTCGEDVGGFLGFASADHPFDLDLDPISVAEGTSRIVTLVFDMPTLATGPEGTLTIPGLDSIPFPLPETLAPPQDISGRYSEIPPRNLRPMLASPVMATLQAQSGCEMLILREEDSLRISFPNTGIIVTGADVHGRPGCYEATLSRGGETLTAWLRQAGENRLVLYLADQPFHQIIFARGDAVSDLPPLPRGVVRMDDANGPLPEPTPDVPVRPDPDSGQPLFPTGEPTPEPDAPEHTGWIFSD